MAHSIQDEEIAKILRWVNDPHYVPEKVGLKRLRVKQAGKCAAIQLGIILQVVVTIIAVPFAVHYGDSYWWTHRSWLIVNPSIGWFTGQVILYFVMKSRLKKTLGREAVLEVMES
jgi:hypothetical protein